MVRVHQFTALAGTERAESVSLVRVTKKANGTIEMRDKGCVATTAEIKSLGPAYFRLPEAVVPVTITGNSWKREKPPIPIPVGFEPAPPAFCSGHLGGAPSAAADYDTELSDYDPSATPSSGSQKAWLSGDKTCTCPAASTSDCSRTNMKGGSCMPAANTGAATGASDCRINDPDKDGRPGYTILTSSFLSAAASIGDTEWSGTLSADGSHTGFALEPEPLYRVFTSCSSAFLCGLASGLASSHTCGPEGRKFNRVEYRKVPPVNFASLSCATFYNGDLDTIASAASYDAVRTAVKQTVIDAYFDGSASAYPLANCTTSATCPSGSICSRGKCRTMTTTEACVSDDECNSNLLNVTPILWKCDNYGTSGADKRSCGPSSCPNPNPNP